MKKFKFKFKHVLEKRKDDERKALLLFSQKQGAYQAQLAFKEGLLQAMENSYHRKELLGSQPVSVLEFKSEQDFIQGTKQRIIQADHRIFRAYKDLERAHLRYMDARKRTKMIEVLEDKYTSEFKAEVKKREQHDLEDLMIMRFRLKENEDAA